MGLCDNVGLGCSVQLSKALNTEDWAALLAIDTLDCHE